MSDNTHNNKSHPNKNARDFLEKYALPLVILFGTLIALFGLIVNIGSAGRISAMSQKPTPTAPAPTQAPTQAPSPTADQTQAPKVAKIIVDAGHGNPDPGTKGNDTGIYEMSINLNIAKFLEEILVENDYEVIMTRSGEDALEPKKEDDMVARENIISNSGADLFVSIHQNWFEDRNVYGPQVFYRPESVDGEVFAGYVQSALNTGLEISKPRDKASAKDRVTKLLPASILVECGFLSNANDERLLSTQEYQKKLAQYIFEGIEAYRASSN